MKRWTQALPLFLLSLAGIVSAVEVTLDQSEYNNERCSGMYSRKSWGGNVDPFILVKFLNSDAKKNGNKIPKVSLVMYEWADRPLLGVPSPDDENHIEYICNTKTVKAKLCKEEELGQFILQENANETAHNVIKTASVKLKENPRPQNYGITKTGFYCVATYAKDTEYTAIVEFRNAYGELEAAQIAKLPFYGGLAIVYAVVGIFWGFLYFQNRHDILAVQNYITAIIIFLLVEMLMTWGFYDYRNQHGDNTGAKAFMIVVAILNAGRNSFSFFLLLIVCMGYGVVKMSLGKDMVYVRYLALAHFVFGVIYAVGSLTVQPEDAGPLILLVVLPMSATLTAFYIWTLNSLSATKRDLEERKQSVKALMYKRLWWCIIGSILVIFLFFLFNSLAFTGVSDPDFAPSHWQSRWFILDGWLNLVYLFDVCFIAYLWRPTANNRRFAMSDEIAQDDDGFEIASLRSSFDEEEGAETPKPTSRGAPPPEYSSHRDVSPLPAPRPQKPVPPPRESLDGETMFAVGEDRWSDDDDNDDDNGGERERLTSVKEN
jgi:hypothetical protein